MTTKNMIKKNFKMRAQFGNLPVVEKVVQLPLYKKAARRHPYWENAVWLELCLIASALGLPKGAKPAMYQINPLSI
jgi:hypothetical protein